MATSAKAKLRTLRFQLAVKPHRDVLYQYLEEKRNSLIQEAVLVTLYRKWSSRPPYGLVEIGIATYDRRSVNCGFSCPPGPHAKDLLREVWSMHLRIRSNAHLPSADACPDTFHFGTSVFVSHEEALDLLYQVWHQPIDEMNLEKGYRPIICLTFGNNDGLGKVRYTDLNFVPMNMDTTIAVLDAQNIAVQSKITSKADAPIEYILPIFTMTPCDVGNAGNAATYITIIAFISVLRDQLYGAESNPRAKPGQKGVSASNCEHMAAKCSNTDLECDKCLNSMAKWRQENAKTHREGMCVFRRFIATMSKPSQEGD
ncbi:hypothetical protein EK21DRAFT_95454 [Setomelanomma holmii]|uniref:Gfd2/YDR514C-like C-terminal domain-containing protein n=1 Tax=Setomelanomma holmii TaxID=210430 RepID=A0A9P4GWK4_9PLEO|nr:hypothetical protein EK21DRAFT_95454 [Setomelanomma holmii]